MSMTQIEIPSEILDSARLTPAELKQELALALYGQRRLSGGKARELAGMSLLEFRRLAAARHIPPHFEESDLEEDLATIDALTQP
jgi:predicted HTH domain antitoxin